MQALLSFTDSLGRYRHAWVCAPPFAIVDVTVGLQDQMTPEAMEALQPYLLVESAPKASTITVADLAENEFVAAWMTQYGSHPTLDDLYRMSPRLPHNIKRYGTFEVGLEKASLKYICCALGGTDCSFEQMNNLCLSGKYPSELYAEFASQ